MPPLAPRPFSQLARRWYALGIGVPRGYWHGLSGGPWYRVARRRRAAVAMCRSRLLSVAARRSSRVYWRSRVLYLDPITCEVA